MLKLNASYSKKVPADGEYTSQSYHASVEVELPDGLNQNQLQTRIHETFALVKESPCRWRIHQSELSRQYRSRASGRSDPRSVAEPNSRDF